MVARLNVRLLRNAPHFLKANETSRLRKGGLVIFVAGTPEFGKRALIILGAFQGSKTLQCHLSYAL
jgi:hypothetical protein